MTPAEVKAILIGTTEIMLRQVQEVPANPGDTATGRPGRAESIAGLSLPATGCGVPAGDPRILRSALLCPPIDDWMAMIEAMPDEGMYNLAAPTPARTLA